MRDEDTSMCTAHNHYLRLLPPPSDNDLSGTLVPTPDRALLFLIGVLWLTMIIFLFYLTGL